MTQIIKMILGYKGMNIPDLATKINSSRPNLSQKLKRDNFELKIIAAALDCELKITFIENSSGKEF